MQHVEQLLRSLNLNSPGPTAPAPKMRNDLAHSPTSPDLSPISTTSALLTPTDLSPAKMFDQKLPSNFEFHSSGRSGDNNSLLFETGYRLQDSLHGPQGFWSSSPSFNSEAGYFPTFEPFPESSSMRGQPPFPPQSQVDRRRLVESTVLPPSLPPLSWGGQRLRPSTTEWLKADDIVERPSPFAANETMFRSTQAQQAPSQRHGSSQAHEVRIFIPR